MDCLFETFTVSDCFGAKTVPEALTRLEEHVEPTHFLWLRRRDTLRQAISLYRASHSGVWQCRDEDTPRPTVPFDRQAIEQVRSWIDSTNEHWQARFVEEQRPVLPLWYEDVCQQPQETVVSIGRFLERPLPEGLVVQASTQLMRDQVTQQWAERLVA
jgi:LPS sulfotransferase NodH